MLAVVGYTVLFAVDGLAAWITWQRRAIWAGPGRDPVAGTVLAFFFGFIVLPYYVVRAVLAYYVVRAVLGSGAHEPAEPRPLRGPDLGRPPTERERRQLRRHLGRD